METGGELLIFGILMLIRHFRRFKGQLIASYLMLYAILRFSTEMFRGDAERGYLIEPWISTSQFVSAIMFLAGFYMYVKLRGRKDAWCARVK
jgi:phosphatidylglycerol:prolipoprotein diacylglycerol transferase